MNSSSTQFATSGMMGLYEPIHHQVSMWENTFNGDFSPNKGAPAIVQGDASVGNKSEYTSYESISSLGNNQEPKKMSDKVQRRLAQNREAARKCRLKKKVHVQQLETCRLKLTQLEQELQRARHQGLYVGGAPNNGHVGLSVPLNSGITVFEMEYGLWIEEEQRQNCVLRKVLQDHISDIELRMFVETGLNHYYKLFQMKEDAAKADVFYLMHGTWRTPVERLFLWLGGFRPSELLNILLPELEPLTDQQVLLVGNLRQSSQQAEDALSLGMDRLQQTLAQSIIADPTCAGIYGSPMASAMENLDAMEGFVNQADHLRRQTLQQMSRILTIRQSARGLLAMGEYFRRLRALSSLWASHPREPA
ncbi:unnamed protein product [Camellia sinensis]|uniref:transcription factor TGA3-like isoform X1 n=2 Tax=Camellia sinensis TaxID=4442 RepID=UPI00103597B8|nr:transcription factor TGA3-like isoform X1 [Camellia sinensis]XP_028056060.1 transcription factor TGA3-like isoform X1 [Camellia sinensis]XP_028056061.1 transcription factor TGA3-like isoform X1 [Camellia sinensis]